MPHINASFDPLTMCLDIPDYEDAAGDFDINNVALNPTIFHELVHSWQLFAFTSGYFTAAIRPIQSVLVPQFLGGHCQSLVKPIIETFKEEVNRTGKYSTVAISFDQKAESPEKLAMFIVHKYYFEFEKLNAVLDDRERYSKDEDRFVLEAFPPSLFHYSGFESSLLDLASMMRTEIAVWLDGRLKWPGKTDLLEYIKRANGPFSPSSDWRNSSLGVASIQEGHARFLEMQLLASHDVDRNDFAFFIENGYWGNRYTRAYKAFLEWSGLTPPTTVLDWRVHLFILVCEYALNPTAPYLDGFELETLFDQFHPANRFKTACRALSKLPSLAPTTPVDPKYMRAAFEAIEEASNPKWAMPLAEAFRIVNPFAEKFLGSDVPFERPFFNLTARHLSTVLLRTGNSSLYLTPLTLVLDGPKTIPFLLPPAIRLASRTVFPEIAVGTKRPTWAGYLIGLMYCDLIDQLLRRGGPFTYECQVVPPDLSSMIAKAANRAFEGQFGISISAVGIARLVRYGEDVMGKVTLEIDGLVDEEYIESVLQANESGFVLENRGVGRSKRYSHIGDVVKVIGEIGSVAGFGRTIWELIKLRKGGAQIGQKETIVRIREANGQTITIKTSDSHSVADIVSALQTLK